MSFTILGHKNLTLLAADQNIIEKSAKLQK